MKIYPGSRPPRLPATVADGLELGKGEQVLSFAVDDNTGAYVVATTLHIACVTDSGDVLLKRPWHEVDTGHWETDTWTLTVTWVDRRRGAQWSFLKQETRFPETFRERVQASVVLSEPLGLVGPRRSGRVVLRKNLSTQQVAIQAVLGRGTPADDPEVQEAVERVGAFLLEQAGG